MKLIFLLFCGVNSFILKPITKPNLKIYNKKPIINDDKISDFLSLIRYKNILPTILLNLSGGWIMNPSIDIISSKPFLVSVINTLLIMSSSMILNDMWDLDVDKINNPHRPLVTGKITMNKAKYLTITLLGLTEFLTINYLDSNLNLIIQLAIINIIIYTPILKKITFIKNISCASLISFAPIFSGLSTNIGVNGNYGLLFTLSGIIFLGSLYNEILLDIRDYDGDSKNNINTIPVVFGNNKAYKIVTFILYFNILFSFSSLSYLYGIEYGLVLPIIWIPMINDMKCVIDSNYSPTIINKVSSNTNIYLFNTIIYLCLINYII